MAYHSFYMLAVALSMITFVDLALAHQPASAMCREALMRAMDRSLGQFSDFMKGGSEAATSSSRRECSELVVNELATASLLAVEAAAEPRWHKGDFKITLTMLLIGKLRKLNA